jgi:FKBP-type peptidyl-prolyl cis-trans isomerase SlpA
MSVHGSSFLTLHYRLTGADGTEVVNTFGDRPATLSLGAGQLAPAMEARLLGLAEGARRVFDLGPGEAFGERHPDKVQRVARRLLRETGQDDSKVGVGDVVDFPAPDGNGRFAGLVREAGDEWLLIDFNHPLAGQAVRFEVQLIGVL